MVSIAMGKGSNDDKHDGNIVFFGVNMEKRGYPAAMTNRGYRAVMTNSFLSNTSPFLMGKSSN
jgi:hypothetical protein